MATPPANASTNSTSSHGIHRRNRRGSAPKTRIPSPLSVRLHLQRSTVNGGMHQRNERLHRMHRISRLVSPMLGALCLFAAPTSAHANRFGPPWQSRVVVDRTTVFSQPDRASPAVGPLDRGQLVIVVGETK